MIVDEARSDTFETVVEMQDMGTWLVTVSFRLLYGGATGSSRMEGANDSGRRPAAEGASELRLGARGCRAGGDGAGT